MSIPRTWHAPVEALLLPAGALVAALALFLCGDAARSITGAAIPVDGGWTAR